LLDHGAVEEDGLGGSRRVDGDDVPQVRVLVDAAVGGNLDRLKLGGGAVIRVPILADAVVVKALQGLQVGLRGVGVEDRLPNREDRDSRLRMFA